VIVLVVLLAGRQRHAADLQARLRDLEASTDRTVKEEVARRLRQEESRLAKDIDARRSELARREEDLTRGQAQLTESRLKSEEQAAALDATAEGLAERAGQFDVRARELEQRSAALEQAEAGVRSRLEEVAGLTTEQARQRLMEEAEREVQADVARMVQRADEAAREATLRALSTLRGSVVAEGTITVVTLPSDEMKGRVIGREGRNIRALEQATGVDLLVDDTPRAILLSSWDPLRRAVASRSLAKLVEDGRIHPARIEEVVDKTRQEVDEESRERGEKVCFELGLAGLKREAEARRR
jgi:ribonuclease Y